MSIQIQVNKSINNFPPGQVFRYADLPVYMQSPGGVVKAVNRLVKSDKLRRLSKGNFYLPKKGMFGELKPSDNELLKSVLFKGDGRVGYITGMSLYNRLGLTTQLPKTVTVATSGARQSKDFGTIIVKLVTTRVSITKQNVPLLELLDALKDLRKIPDTRPASTLIKLMALIDELTDKQRQQMTKLALQYYPAATRALLGLILSSLSPLNCIRQIEQLKNSLNPVTLYNIGLSTSAQFGELTRWYIQ